MKIFSAQKTIKPNKGFTLVELAIVMALFIILMAFTSISLTTLTPTASVTATRDVLISDIKAQQMQAMTGSANGTGTSVPQGIYFETDQYTLFSGAAYSESDPHNLVIQMPNGITLTGTNLPSNSIIFEPSSGEVQNYLDTSDTIQLQHSTINEAAQIEINQLGVITSR